MTVKNQPVILEIGKAEVLMEGVDIAIWAIGPMVGDALSLAKLLAEQDISTSVVNARFIKPIDIGLLTAHAISHQLVVTMEDHVLSGGFGSAVLETLQEKGIATPVHRIGWPDRFIGHGNSVHSLRNANGLSQETLENQILDKFKSPGGEAKVLPSTAGVGN